ncbi:hypothetical protein Pnap_2840 [Polaromonas naphthalenivorans CJ2]|uniref:Glyoxalase/bleomycin resistance protein/dioxygenase n=1 Tax=Polaromonas naphthalenivorans (strain CJ2) TaxID=365044 RepID=A1VR64_POLNA|nr:hypothetical protein Pnap_2840 [Polaromonas naphthalenivorans CJ2]
MRKAGWTSTQRWRFMRKPLRAKRSGRRSGHSSLAALLRLRVLLVNDSAQPLDTYSLDHLGLGVADKAAVIAAYHAALATGTPIVKPPRTTWRGTPLHELWLRDPAGYLIEVYARLTGEELAQMPPDQEPVFLVPGTAAA